MTSETVRMYVTIHKGGVTVTQGENIVYIAAGDVLPELPLQTVERLLSKGLIRAIDVPVQRATSRREADHG